MNLAEKLIKDFEALSDERKKEVVDFVEFLKHKDEQETLSIIDQVLAENDEAFKELAK